MDVKFYRCLSCGNVICKVVDSGVVPECCGSKMVLLEPKSIDNGVEKHLPVLQWIDVRTLTVMVGAQPHPATTEHHIVMIALEYEDGVEIRLLDYMSGAPQATFLCRKEKLKGVYSYCNLHGLWYLPYNK